MESVVHTPLKVREYTVINKTNERSVKVMAESKVLAIKIAKSLINSEGVYNEYDAI